MRAAFPLFLALIVGCAGAGAGSDDDDDDPSDPEEPAEPTIAVYVSGYYGDGWIDTACYWKGTTLTDLPGTYEYSCGRALAIDVSGGTVYVGGEAGYNNYTACYWEDAARIDMDGYRVSGIRAEGGVVYTGVVGSWTNGYGAAYGEGTEITELPGIETGADPIHYYDSYALGTAVAGGTVYTVGYANGENSQTACYWTGSARTQLNENGKAFAIEVEAGTVYTAGYYNNGTREVPCFWTGTTKTDLPDDGILGGAAYGIHVADGIVYTAGYYNDGNRHIPCYWTGTTRTDLPDYGANGGQALGIQVVDGIVYTAGYYNDGTMDRPCYWTGTVRTDLPCDAASSGCATGIAVRVE